MYYNPVKCDCMALQPVPRTWMPKVPRHWWHALPPGIATWQDNRWYLHRGDGTFIDAETESLDAAISLVLNGADNGEIESQGLGVIDAESF